MRVSGALFAGFALLLVTSTVRAQPRELDHASDSAREAAAAYRTALRSYGAGDRAAYEGAYADTLSCFYGRRSAPRSAALRSRQRTVDANREAGPERASHVRAVVLRVEREGPDEIVLHDWGWAGDNGFSRQTVYHSKRIVLRRIGGSWRITAEAPIGRACREGPTRADPPPLWTLLQSVRTSLLADCSGSGVGSSIGCSCETNAPDAERFCAEQLGCDPDDVQSCPSEPMRRCYDHAGRELAFFCLLDDSEPL